MGFSGNLARFFLSESNMLEKSEIVPKSRQKVQNPEKQAPLVIRSNTPMCCNNIILHEGQNFSVHSLLCAPRRRNIRCKKKVTQKGRRVPILYDCCTEHVCGRDFL
ncbi:unnamed protein product [Sphacelaria rigidula]